MKRRRFLGRVALAATALAGSRARARARAVPERAFRLSSLGCGRATGYAETNKIVTREGRTHAAWLDSADGKFIVRVRTLDRTRGSWAPTVTVGEAHDNHGGPALTIDREGYLHIVYYPHHHPFRYRRSRRPNDATEWGPEEHFGGRCTYPTLVCAPDDTLLLTCRESYSDRRKPWEVTLYTKRAGKPWSEPRTILRADRTGYAHFQEALAWGPGQSRLHLSCRFYSGGRGHTVAHLWSDDRGETWRDSANRPVSLPATADTVSPIVRDPGAAGVGFRCGALAVDGENVPHIVYSSYDLLPLESWLVSLEAAGSPDGPRWRRRPLRDALPADHREWGLTLPGGIVMTPAGEMLLVLTLIKPSSGEDSAVWGHPSSEPLLLRSTDGGSRFTSELLTVPDASRARWLPSLERPTAADPVRAPGLIYTDGSRGERNTDILANEVFWIDPT